MDYNNFEEFLELPDDRRIEELIGIKLHWWVRLEIKLMLMLQKRIYRLCRFIDYVD